MKNILLAINIILILLVGYLYYLHFSDTKKVVVPGLQIKTGTGSREAAKVAYIDLDSLQNNYTYYKKIKTEFEHRQAAGACEQAGRAGEVAAQNDALSAEGAQGEAGVLERFALFDAGGFVADQRRRRS